MTKTDTDAITIWAGCDPQMASALTAFSQAWGPYSAQSRRYSIFWLLRKLIDPAWFSLCQRTPALSCEELNRALKRYRDERIRRGLAYCGELELTKKYSLSITSHYLGFDELDWFIRAVSRNVIENYGYLDLLMPTLDSLRELAIACRAKKPKRESGRKVNLLLGQTTCRFCNQPTELALYAAGRAWPEEDANDPGRISRLSALYCCAHRPKKAFSDTVEADYSRAKRNQGAFEREIERLDFQSWAGTTFACAKSGNSLVDDFIWRFSVHRCLTHEQQSFDELSTLETRIRREARMLVDWRITDRKKEIIALLSSGLNQTQVAERLGLKSRQAISKTIQSIPSGYRLDLP